MRIPDALIGQFQSLYRQAFGVDITAEEAQIQGLAVMRLVAIRQENLMNKEDENENGQKISPRNIIGGS